MMAAFRLGAEVHVCLLTGLLGEFNSVCAMTLQAKIKQK